MARRISSVPSIPHYLVWFSLILFLQEEWVFTSKKTLESERGAFSLIRFIICWMDSFWKKLINNNESCDNCNCYQWKKNLCRKRPPKRIKKRSINEELVNIFNFGKKHSIMQFSIISKISGVEVPPKCCFEKYPAKQLIKISCCYWEEFRTLPRLGSD